MSTDGETQDGVKQGHRKLTWFGIAATVLWLGGAVWFALHKVDQWPNMGLNAWGDFFAGAVAPIAFLWLMIGYFQQGFEIRQNTLQLCLQYDALKQSV